jgi:hypothetical protein
MASNAGDLAPLVEARGRESFSIRLGNPSRGIEASVPFPPGTSVYAAKVCTFLPVMAVLPVRPLTKA